MESRLIHPVVQPIYPEAARTAGESGTIVLDVAINEEGFVTEVSASSGPPLLRIESPRVFRRLYNLREGRVYGRQEEVFI
jgi:outer membrane biosynthesis protein TonB